MVDCMQQKHESVRIGHCKQDDTDVYIGRGRGSDGMLEISPEDKGWIGNPFSVSEHGRERCLELFEQAFARKILMQKSFWCYVSRLSGKTLGCWCRTLDENQPACHGDVIARWLDEHTLAPNCSQGNCTMRLLCSALVAGWDCIRDVEMCFNEGVHVTLVSGECVVGEYPIGALKQIFDDRSDIVTFNPLYPKSTRD